MAISFALFVIVAGIIAWHKIPNPQVKEPIPSDIENHFNLLRADIKRLENDVMNLKAKVSLR